MVMSLNYHSCWLTIRHQRKLQNCPWVPLQHCHQRRGRPAEHGHHLTILVGCPCRASAVCGLREIMTWVARLKPGRRKGRKGLWT